MRNTSHTDHFKLYCNLIDNSSVLFFVCDPEGRFIGFNKAWYEILGYPHNKMYRKRISDLQSLTIAYRDKSIFESLFQGHGIRGYETEFLDKSGKTVYVVVNAWPEKNEKGESCGASGSLLVVNESLYTKAKLYRMLIETTDTGFVIIDQQGTVLDANREYISLTGYQDLSEIIGKKVTEWTAGYDRKKNYDAIKFACKNGQVRNLELDYVNSAGKITPIEVNATIVPSDHVTKIAALCRDITERRRTQEKLSKSESRYRRLHETMMDGFVQIDTEGRIVDYNESYRRMHGYTSEELLKLSYENLTPEKWHKMEGDILKNQVLTRGYSDVYIKEHLKKDGTTFPVELRTFLLKNDAGINEGMWAIVRDITERKLAEKAISESELRYRTLFTNAKDTIFIMKNEYFIECNPQTLIMYGTPRESILGHTPFEFSPEFQPDGRRSEDAAKELIEKAFRGEPQFFEWLHCKLDGTLFYAEILLNEFKIGSEQFLQAIVRDISERKQAEKELKEEKALSDAIINTLPGMFYLYEDGQRLVRWNKPLEALTGIVGEANLNRRPEDFFEENEKPLVSKAIEELWHFGTKTIELRFPTKNGSIKPYLFTAVKFTINEKSYLLGNGIDISPLRQAIAAAQESEERFKILSEASYEAIVIHRDGIIIDINTGAESMSGYQREELIGMNLITSIVAPEYREMAKQRVMSKTESAYEVSFIRKDGRRVLAQTRAKVITYKGKPSRIVVLHDITDIKKNEASLKHLNRELRALSDCNQVLVRAESEKALLENICTIICNDAGYKMSWVGFIEQDDVSSLKVVAKAGNEDGFLEKVKTCWNPESKRYGPVRLAMHTKNTVVINDFEINEITSPWHELAHDLGYKAAISLPLLDQKKNVFGVLSIYANEPDAFNSQEIRLLEELSADLSFGIMSLRSKHELKQTEENLRNALKERETLLQELLHRTKNNMQVISSLMEMQAMETEDKTVQKMVEEMTNRIRAMALVHEKLYQSKSLSTINLQDYLIDLFNLLVKSSSTRKDGITFQLNIESVFVTFDIAIPCGLIVTELLTNSLKYAFPENRRGTIILLLKKLEHEKVELTFSDNGIGTARPIDLDTVDTIGIQLVVSIVEKQLNGKISLSTEGGFHWNIVFDSNIYKARI